MSDIKIKSGLSRYEQSSKKPVYQSIIKRHDIKVTNDRLHDFRMTMREIVDQKNGILPSDSIERLDVDIIPRLKKTVNVDASKLRKTIDIDASKLRDTPCLRLPKINQKR